MSRSVQNDLLDAERVLDKWQMEFPSVVRAAAETRLVYDQSYAEAVDEIAHRDVDEKGKPPTVDVVKARAGMMVKQQREAARLAEADLDAAKEVIKINLAILSSYQTRAKMELAEMGMV